MTQRTKAGASLLLHHDGCDGCDCAMPARIRAIEDEMLDKVAAAVRARTGTICRCGAARVYHDGQRRDHDYSPRYPDLSEALAAIEDIRKEASDGR